jgi:hypothetical protein
MGNQQSHPAAKLPRGFPGCEEARRLLQQFVDAAHFVTVLSLQQIAASTAGDDADFERFELILYTASELRQNAKYALLLHVQEHGCITGPGGP